MKPQQTKTNSPRTTLASRSKRLVLADSALGGQNSRHRSTSYRAQISNFPRADLALVSGQDAGAECLSSTKGKTLYLARRGLKIRYAEARRPLKRRWKPAMQLELIIARPEHESVLQNLLQYYVYDWSELLGMDVTDTGAFSVPALGSYWSDPKRHPFLARVAGKYAGFALVEQRSRITSNAETFDMAEFFVLRKYRRHGLGRALATQVFDSLRGTWEARQKFENQTATAFWRAVIADYTHGQFEELVVDDERWHGPVQRFDNSLP